MTTSLATYSCLYNQAKYNTFRCQFGIFPDSDVLRAIVLLVRYPSLLFWLFVNGLSLEYVYYTDIFSRGFSVDCE